MDIRAIKLYLDLCDTLHFSRTATRMHVSPSTLSRTLQRLEDEVGSKLLERDNRSVTLTHAGEAFRRFASQTLTQWQELRRELDPQQKLLRGTLQLYCSVTAAYSHLPALLDKFRRQQPWSISNSPRVMPQMRCRKFSSRGRISPSPLCRRTFRRVCTLPP